MKALIRAAAGRFSTPCLRLAEPGGYVPDVDYLRKRDRLAELLHEGAELEHALCCQYLYAAFSLKQDPQCDSDLTPSQFELVRGWKSNLLLIARQEMVHLATVCNLLTAVGEAPHFWRPDFPVASSHFPFGTALNLTAFDRRFLENAIRFEEPFDKDPQFEMGQLYSEVHDLIEELGARNERALLVGPVSAQVDNSTFLPSSPDTERAMRRPMFDMMVRKIRSVADALRAVTTVREEGEGSPTKPSGGHFTALKSMQSQLVAERQNDPRFSPARLVVDNPWREQDSGVAPGAPGRTILKHPAAVEMADAFNLAYQVMLRMLILFFTRNPLSRSGFRAIQNVAFLPLMSLVIRPIGEMLSLLPAFDDDREERAGAPFRCSRRVHQLPHAEAAWEVLEGQLLELVESVRDLENRADLPPSLKPRLTMLFENTSRIHLNFESLLGEV
jgi:hypothetical protein